MRFLRRWSLPAALPACLLFLATTGAARAADDKTPPPEAKSTDALVRQALYEVANEGADMYNAEGRYANQERDLAGCYRLYEGALLAVRPLLASHADLQKAIDEGLENARKTPEVYKRALVLREVLDKVRADLKQGGPSLPPPVKTLWDRLGGEAGVAKTVDDFVAALETDPKVDFSRGGKYLKDAAALKHFKRMLVEQISTATGGPFKYTGRPMKDVHKGMEITNEEFDATVADLKGALKKNGVAADDVKAVLDVVETTRKDIVEGKKEPPPPPKETKVTGKVAKIEKDLLRVHEEGGKEDRVFFIPAEARVTLDGKEDKLENLKVDSAVTVTVRGEAVTKVEAKAPVPPPPPPPADTLWERLGGETAVAKVVDDFVAAASEDKDVNFYRDATFRPTKEQVADLKTHLVDFISSVTGGPHKYTGKNMKVAHRGMGITDKEFDAAAKDLKTALEKNGVKDAAVKDLMAVVETTRKDVVEKKEDDKPKPDDKDKPAPDESATISGKVTFKGLPLPSGRVRFVNADGKAFSADIKEDGSYKVEGLAPREYSIAVELKAPDPNDPAKPKVVLIPAKYADAKTSGLIISASKGKQTKDFDLSD